MILAGGLMLTACAAKPAAVKPGVDFSRIRKISVASFEGAGGREVADEFVRQLLAAGLEVTDNRHAGDATLKGTVTSYTPARTLMVFLGKTTILAPGGQPLTVNNPILAPGSSQAVPQAAGLGVSNAQVVKAVYVQSRQVPFSHRLR